MNWLTKFWARRNTRMTTEKRNITVGDVSVEVVRKDIKNLYLRIYPPNAHVRLTAPLALEDEALRQAVLDKLGWIKRHQATFTKQPPRSKYQMVNGETHYFLGHRYRLHVHEADAPPRVAIRETSALDLFVRPGTGSEKRHAILTHWYRKQLKLLIPDLLEKWQPIMGVEASAWGIRKMKTRWGSCNITHKRIWLNLELAKYSEQCIEYVVVHELAHLLERLHNPIFFAHMDKFLPQWRSAKEALAQLKL